VRFSRIGVILSASKGEAVLARTGKNWRFGSPGGPIKPCWKPVFTFIDFD